MDATMFGNEHMSPCHWVFVVGTQNLSIWYNDVGGGRGEFHGWCTEIGFTFSYWDWIQGGTLSPIMDKRHLAIGCFIATHNLSIYDNSVDEGGVATRPWLVHGISSNHPRLCIERETQCT